MRSLWDLDQSIFRAIHLGWHQDWLDPVFWVLSTTGLGYVQVILVVLLFSRWRDIFERFRNPPPDRIKGRLVDIKMFRWRDFNELVSPVVAAIVVSGLLNGIVKKAVPRDRPSNYIWAHPQEGFFGNSFSSGHTTTSFAIAFMLLLLTWRSERRWVGLLALVWASLVGLSRVYRGVHWPSDVLSGIFVGLTCACAVELLRQMIVAKRQTISAGG